jgi:signal transduction histidine kinase
MNNKHYELALKKLDKISKEQAGQALQSAMQEIAVLEMALDSLTNGILVLAPDHTLLLTNKYAKHFLPIDESESGVPIWVAVQDGDVSAFLQQTVSSGDRVLDREFFVEKSGVKRLLAISVLPLVSSGRVSGELVTVEDITEKRIRESKLRQAENLASLTNVAAGVAHEIKNPLASISIHIQLIQKLLGKTKQNITDGIKYEKFDKYLSTVNEEIDRLNKIVVDFLFAVRPMEMNFIKSDVNEIIASVVQFVQYELKENHIKCALDLQKNMPYILIDKQYLYQALLNIIKNAIEAMKDGGKLAIQTTASDLEIKMRITDTGCGISEANKAKIFEPYWTTKIKGTGLGLTLVFKIIREHKGEISLESQEGKGSAFIISLPIPQKEKRLTDFARAACADMDCA